MSEMKKRLSHPYTLSEVSRHCHPDDCWIIVGDHVYDVTSFLDQHPGGKDVLIEQAGRDATLAFFGAGHHEGTFQLLEPFCIGILVQHERIRSNVSQEVVVAD
ncbi:cytochrome b5 [Parasteatoda tepidariorum]|nr:cytochrome b5 [Parasteatoda tepidariorum]XP_042900381.1 cytochrome b5 [Parasteatoda tepidariorum]